MDTITQKLDQTLAQSETEKSNIMSQLRLCLSAEALETLLLKEQHRQQELNSAINCSANAQTECLQTAGEDFVTSLASLTEELLALLDVLMTADDVTKTTGSITTDKCTHTHEVVIQERDATIKRFGEMYRSELQRLNSDKHKRLLEVEKWNYTGASSCTDSQTPSAKRSNGASHSQVTTVKFILKYNKKLPLNFKKNCIISHLKPLNYS
ncbi:hypothetical protein WMY93_018338 [Mugilogobius chulae]|uniref:DUF4456 domain-containing protein n=1 Tax=Mugilogobius chulae TaxID=88201 RepID=A0AAW0NVT7_9GOBI